MIFTAASASAELVFVLPIAAAALYASSSFAPTSVVPIASRMFVRAIPTSFVFLATLSEIEFRKYAISFAAPSSVSPIARSAVSAAFFAPTIF